MHAPSDSGGSAPTGREAPPPAPRVGGTAGPSRPHTPAHPVPRAPRDPAPPPRRRPALGCAGAPSPRVSAAQEAGSGEDRRTEARASAERAPPPGTAGEPRAPGASLTQPHLRREGGPAADASPEDRLGQAAAGIGDCTSRGDSGVGHGAPGASPAPLPSRREDGSALAAGGAFGERHGQAAAGIGPRAPHGDGGAGLGAPGASPGQAVPRGEVGPAASAGAWAEGRSGRGAAGARGDLSHGEAGAGRGASRSKGADPAGPSRIAAADPAEPPFALTERAAKGLRLAAVNAPAAAAGLAPGMTLSDARARLPGLLAEEIDRAADARALEALARWATRWSPTVAVDGRDGLTIDVTGAAHLFGGEAALMADLSARLDRAGIAHRLGLAPAPGAAWALAHAAPGRLTRIEGGAEALPAGLADLPVAGLRLGAEARTLLRRFGLVRIGQLEGLDRSALARRFRDAGGSAREAEGLAERVLIRLDQAMGRLAEPLRPLAPPPEHAARLPCPEPLRDRSGVEAGLARLLARLSDDLEAAGQGARRFRLRAYRADGTEAAVEARAARPSRAAEHVARLFRDRLEDLDPGYGIDLLTLEAAGLAPLDPAPRGLGPALGAAETDAAALAALADRLAARLGPEAVTVRTPVESHLPERAERASPFDGALPDWDAARPGPWGARPLRLLDRPEPVEAIAEVPDGPPLRFVWRRVARRAVRAEGPERLGPEWWRAEPGAPARARDCYRVEDTEGRRYWLCRTGLYGDGRGDRPRWHLHGLFP